MRRFLKYILYLFLGFLLLVILLLGFTQTQWFRDWLRDFAVEQGKSFLNGELQIDRIEGNLVSRLEINGILLKNDRDTVLYLPRFEVKLQPLALLKNEIRVDSVLIDSPYVNLFQLPDSSWNLAHLLKSDSAATPGSVEEPSQPFNMQIVLGDFYLKDGRVDISSFIPSVPKQVRGLTTRFSGSYGAEKQEIHLKTFKFRSLAPELNLRELSFRAARDAEKISLKDFVLQTAGNQLNGEGAYYPQETLASSASLQTAPLDFGEIRLIVPDVMIFGRPEISLLSRMRNDSLYLKLDIREGRQGIFLQSHIINLRQFLSDSSSIPLRYSLSGNIENLHIARWLGDPELDYIVRGNFQLAGRGTTAEEAMIDFKANFPNCIFLQRSVAELKLNARYNKGDLTGQMSVRGDFGSVFLNAGVLEISGRQQFTLQGNVRDFNIARLRPEDSLETDINLNLSAEGQNFDPAKMEGSIKLNFAPSAIMEIAIDTLLAGLHFSGGDYKIDSLRLGSNFAALDITGAVNLEAESNLNFQGELRDLMALKSFIRADTVHAAGKFSGGVNGRLDSLKVNADLQLQDIVYNAFSVDSLEGGLSALEDSGGLGGEATVRIFGTGTADMNFREIAIRTDFSRRLFNILLEITHSDSIFARLQTRVYADSIPRLVFPDMLFQLRDREWRGGSGDMQLTLDGDDFHFQNFKLTAPIAETGEERSLLINGTFSTAGKEDLQVHISGIDLGTLARLGEVPLVMEGLFYTDLDIRGSAESPVIKGSAAIRDGQVEEFFYTLKGVFDYEDERLSWHFGLVPNGKDSLDINGYLPVNLSFANQGEFLYEDRPLKVNLKSGGIPLTALQVGIDQLDEVQGSIVCDLNLHNTLKDPRAKGFLNIVDGAFKLSEYGIDYKDFQLRASVDSTRISLDSLRAKRDDGFVKASGYLEIDSSLVSGVIKSTQFKLLADKFYLARHKNYEIQISADMNLGGNTRSPQFGGKISVLRSSFYLPAFTQASQTPAATEENVALPMLVEALENLQQKADTLKPEAGLIKKEEEQASEMYKNLSGSLKVSIPRNTWIKSPEMRLEIDGDVDLVKNGPEFEIFGTISIVRGHYDLFGRRFNITEGKLTFQGGEEINPAVLLTAEYKFHDAAREKKTLVLTITDKALTPKLQFTMDDKDITEGDAISYVMFGRSLDELTYGQQSTVAGESGGGSAAGGLAMGLAASYLSGEITKSVGKDLNLDYIEIKGQDNWSSATFVVGKYLTNDLFISYERGFGEASKDEATKETITLEYQITRYIFFQLFQGSANTNGFDVFFKFQRQ